MPGPKNCQNVSTTTYTFGTFCVQYCTTGPLRMYNSTILVQSGAVQNIGIHTTSYYIASRLDSTEYITSVTSAVR